MGTLVKQDGKVYKFLDGRTMKAHLLKRNPRKVTWTVLYRRKHNKGIEAETSKKRTKRTQKPEVRKAQREQAIRAAKELKKTTKATTKKPAAATSPPKAAQKAQKPQMKAAPRVGGKR